MTDAVALEKVLDHIHNWFTRDILSVPGCEVVDGQLPASVTSSMVDGQWYRVQGSYLNDGLYQYREEYPEGESSGLVDETFDGTVSLLAIPRTVLEVADGVAEWVAARREAMAKVASGPYQSESFSDYSYTIRSDLAGGSSGSGDGLSGWQAEYRSDLNPYRRLP